MSPAPFKGGAIGATRPRKRAMCLFRRRGVIIHYGEEAMPEMRFDGSAPIPAVQDEGYPSTNRPEAPGSMHPVPLPFLPLGLGKNINFVKNASGILAAPNAFCLHSAKLIASMAYFERFKEAQTQPMRQPKYRKG